MIFGHLGNTSDGRRQSSSFSALASEIFAVICTRMTELVLRFSVLVIQKAVMTFSANRNTVSFVIVFL